MKKRLSALLAASMVLSSFSSVALAADDASLDAQAKFDALKEKGIFEGFTDGTAGLNQNMTRAQFARVAALLAGADLDNPPATASFTDVPVGHWAFEEVEAAKEAGFISGRGNGVFDPSSDVTIQELARVLVDVLDIEVDADAEVEGAADWAAPYVQAAIDNGLISADADFKASAKRELLVEASYVAKAELDKKAPGNLALTNKVLGLKKVELSFGTAVDNTKADITVKRGTNNVDIKSVKYADDKKSATVEFTSDLREGDHTVTVSGISEDALTSEFEIEAEKVAAIEFVSENAVKVNRADNTATPEKEDENQVTVQIKVTNQYGEDVTDDYADELEYNFTDVEDNGWDYDERTGLITLTHEDTDGEFDINDKIFANARYFNEDTDYSVVMADATLTVAPEAYVDTIEVTQLYTTDTDDEVLDVEDLEDEDWYLVVSAKDQYGRDIKNKEPLIDDVSVTVLNDDIFEVDEADFIDNLDIDGDDYTAVKLTDPDTTEFDGGETTVIMISKTGKRSEYKVEVKERVQVDTIQFSTPNAPAAGDKIVVPFEAIDQFGDVITDIDVLERLNPDDEDNVDISPSKLERPGKYGFYQNYKKDTAEFIIDTKDVAVEKGDRVTIRVTTDTLKTETFSFTLGEEAEAGEIKGVDPEEFDLAYLEDATEQYELKLKWVEVLDQYGEDFDPKYVQDLTGLDETNHNQYKLVVKSSKRDALDIVEAPNTGDEEYTLYDRDRDGDYEDEILNVIAAKKGQSSFELVLYKWDQEKASDTGKFKEVASKTLRVKTVEKKDIKDYTVTVENKVLDRAAFDRLVLDGDLEASKAADYDEKIKVKGILSDDTKVAIPVRDENYQVTITKAQFGYDTVTGNVYAESDGTDFPNNLFDDDDDDRNESTTATVTILAHGPSIVKTVEITASDKDPEVTKLSLNKDYDSNNNEVDDDILYVSQVNSKDTAVLDRDEDDFKDIVVDALKVKDQYGVTLTGLDRSKFTISLSNFVTDVEEADKSKTKDVSKLVDGDSLTVTVVSNDTGKVLTFKAVITD